MDFHNGRAIFEAVGRELCRRCGPRVVQEGDGTHVDTGEPLLEGTPIEPEVEDTTIFVIVGILGSWTFSIIQHQDLPFGRVEEVVIFASASAVVGAIKWPTTRRVKDHGACGLVKLRS